MPTGSVIAPTYAVAYTAKESPPVAFPEHPDRVFFCSCVKGARYLGLALPPIQTPKDLPANSSPRKGVGVIQYFASSDTWHVSVTLTDPYEGKIKVGEWNYDECAYTERIVSLDDPTVQWYYSPESALSSAP